MFINHPKRVAQYKAITFTVLLACSIGIGLAGSFIMATIHHADIGFWLGLGIVFVAIFTFFWSMLGLVFSVIQYNNA